MIYDWLSTTTTDEESLWFMIDYHLDKGIKKWGNQDSLFDNPSVLLIKKKLLIYKQNPIIGQALKLSNTIQPIYNRREYLFLISNT